MLFKRRSPLKRPTSLVASRFMAYSSATVEAAARPRGAASPIKPVHELHGDILLDLDRPDEAVGKFETSLLRMPRPGRSLLGLARASHAAGEPGKTSETSRELTRVWRGRTSFDGYRGPSSAQRGTGARRESVPGPRRPGRKMGGPADLGTLQSADALRPGSSLPDSPGVGDHPTGTRPPQDTRTRRMILSAPAPLRSRRRNPGCSAA